MMQVSTWYTFTIIDTMYQLIITIMNISLLKNVTILLLIQSPELNIEQRSMDKGNHDDRPPNRGKIDKGEQTVHI